MGELLSLEEAKYFGNVIRKGNFSDISPLI